MAAVATAASSAAIDKAVVHVEAENK